MTQDRARTRRVPDLSWGFATLTTAVGAAAIVANPDPGPTHATWLLVITVLLGVAAGVDLIHAAILLAEHRHDHPGRASGAVARA